MQPKEILSLSSGTMAKVMSDSGQWLLYQCRDGWFVDQEPDARLVFWQVQSDDNEYGEKYSFQKYVAVSAFLGREIVFGLSGGG